VRSRIAVLSVIATVTLASLAACGGDDPASDPAIDPAPSSAAVPLPGAGTSVRVSSIDNSFRPEVLEIAAGTEVVFTNDGRNDHDVIQSGLPDGAPDWGVVAADFAPRDEYRVVFEVPGSYPYYCSIHGTAQAGMVGEIIVTG
jgi:plastocyanin